MDMWKEIKIHADKIIDEAFKKPTEKKVIEYITCDLCGKKESLDLAFCNDSENICEDCYINK
jgi:hypothetical protein